MRCRLISFIFFIIVLLCSCHKDDKLYYSLGYPKEQPLKILIDREFNFSEQLQIKKAFNTWERASSERIKFDINWNEPKPGYYFQFMKPKINSGIFFWSLKANDKGIVPKEQEIFKNLNGLTVSGRGNNAANLIIFKETNEDRFYQVALHEIGHLLGLNHTDDKNWAVMNRFALGNCITPEDAEQLCKLYDCPPRPECSGYSLISDKTKLAIQSRQIDQSIITNF